MDRHLESARQVLSLESRALERAASRIDASFSAAVDCLLAATGRIVVTGIGKSGLVARKISATFTATGSPSVFLHPAEALHGDLGVYEAGDPTILLSKSGATDELLRLVPLLRRLESPLIGILGNPAGPLARMLDVVLDASVEREADPHDMVPTASALVALSLGDALAVSLMGARGFQPADFGLLHPGGQLGRNLRMKVRDVMHHDDAVAWVSSGASLKEAVIAMTSRNLGAACVVDASGALEGLITDGDVRRALQNEESVFTFTADRLMTRNPIRIGPDEPLKAALEMMENRPSQLSVLPVVDPVSNRCLGLVRLHDIYQPR